MRTCAKKRSWDGQTAPQMIRKSPGKYAQLNGVVKLLRIHGTGIICLHLYHKNQPNVGKYTIHGSSQSASAWRMFDPTSDSRGQFGRGVHQPSAIYN